MPALLPKGALLLMKKARYPGRCILVWPGRRRARATREPIGELSGRLVLVRRGGLPSRLRRPLVVLPGEVVSAADGRPAVEG